MAFDENLAARIRKLLPSDRQFSEKKMFGGLAFLLDGKMCCGVLNDQLVARIGPEQSKLALNKPHVSPMDFTGRPLKGYIYVASQGLKSATALRAWLHQAVSFTLTIKQKTSSRSRRVTVSQIDTREVARATPLSKLINFGPVTLPEFKAMGLSTYGQLEDLGWEAVCRKWAENYPERLNVNAFIGVIATLEGISWTRASASDKAKARRFVNELKAEYGLPVRKPPKRTLKRR